MQKPTYVVVKKETIDSLSFAIWNQDGAEIKYNLDTLRISLDQSKILAQISAQLNELARKFTPERSQHSVGYNEFLLWSLRILNKLEMNHKDSVILPIRVLNKHAKPLTSLVN